jgi:asparagine synthase (glutamine-hydrolysing)
VILAAYDHYGTDCVKKFNGMWAFALYDKTRELIFCSRDRFGVKPFYYSDSSSVFAFGSEIKQLLNFQKKREANIPILMDYLVAGLDDHSNETFFTNIFKLEQSHSLIYDLKNHNFSISRYYELNSSTDTSHLNEADSVSLYKNLLEDSIRLRLRSDVRVGTCLSGGLDSSSVATIAASSYNSNNPDCFTAITAVTLEKDLDESAYAEQVALNGGLNWHTITPTAVDFKENLRRIIEIQEEPFGGPSVFMQYKVFEKARHLGCTVMLDGQGGDETLLGYERYYPAYLISMGFLRGVLNFFRSSSNSRLSKKELFNYLIYFTVPEIRLHRLRRRLPFIRKAYFDLINKKLLAANAKNYLDIGSLQKIELMRMQLPHLLKYEDRNSMYHSIESRLPFIDYRLVETALSINNAYKIKGGWTKYLLRKAMEGILPEKIVWRRNKLGFNAPEKNWLDSINDIMKESISRSEILEKISVKSEIPGSFDKLNPRLQWRLFNIAQWEEIYNVTI